MAPERGSVTLDEADKQEVIARTTWRHTMFANLTALEKYELLTRLVRGYQNTKDDALATELFDISLQLA
jgi:hypothetical protein